LFGYAQQSVLGISSPVEHRMGVNLGFSESTAESGRPQGSLGLAFIEAENPAPPP
jgi:hypothetical protein